MVKRFSTLMLVLSAAALFAVTACGNTVSAAGTGVSNGPAGGASGTLVP